MEAFLIEIIFEKLFPLKLIVVDKLEDNEILLEIKLDFILIDEESNLKNEGNVVIFKDYHFGVDFSCYFRFGQRVDYF